MLFHWPHFSCTNKKIFLKWRTSASDYHGFRRYRVDPRLVATVQIHRTRVPRLGGIDVDADVACLNRYPGILEESAEGMHENNKAQWSGGLVDQRLQVALLAKEAKQQLHADSQSQAQKTKGVRCNVYLIVSSAMDIVGGM